MREANRDLFRLRHILSAMENVNLFMIDKSLDDLAKDAILYYAVVKNVEIIGEAAYKLSKEFIDSHPSTPWNLIIKMRHILVHGYYQVEADQLYEVYREDIPLLIPQIEGYIKELSETGKADNA